MRSPVFVLAAAEGLRLWAQAGSSLDLDAFVYDAVTTELVGRSDDEEIQPSYEWRSVRNGRYYVIVRNVSAQRGPAMISVLPRDDTRSSREVRTPNAAVMNVYYATDRTRTASNHRGVTYGTEPAEADRIEYGVIKVSVPRAHAMGELEGPSILKLEFNENPEKHVVLLSVVPVQDRPFFKSISDRVARSTRQDALVFVHGFSVTFEDAARRTAQIAYDLGFEGAAVLYSWPSQGRLGLIDYNRDGRNAELSWPHLRAFLLALAERTSVRTIHIIAHSMGNRVVVKAIAGDAVSSSTGPLRIREIALMAPDIDAAEFRRLAVAVKQSADRVTLYASSRDRALQAAQRLVGYPRAGEGGGHLVVLPGVVETIDSSAVDTSLLGLGHSYFADSSTILSDLFRLIRGDSARDRFRLHPVQCSQGQYWTFAP